MCRITDDDLDSCLLCRTSGHRKCSHEIAVCTNAAVHPRWNVYYYKNSGGIATFQGCGFCKNATKAGLSTPANSLLENPGWPGCCYPPVSRNYGWIPPEDWPLVAAYHKMEIPQAVQSALDNLNAQKNKHGKKAASDRLTIDVPSSRMIQQPVPIPKSNGYAGSQARSYSPSAIHISPADRTSPRSSTSSKDSNSSGSPPSSNGSRRGRHDFDGPDRGNPSPTLLRPSSQDDPRMIRSSSSQSRRNESPVDRIARGETVNGKRRSNSDPKHQPPPPSAYERQKERDPGQTKGRESPTQIREKDRESPTQTRFRSSSSSSSSNHPYSNPHSAASSSMKRLAPVDPISQPRQPPPPPVPRARQANAPSITSVMAGMSLNPTPNTTFTDPTAAAYARIQMGNADKRGAIPPHVRRAGSVISASSSSSSSTNSSAREGTVVSDGAFTDYLSDDSDFDMQRQAEIDAENAYQEALRKHEEMEFREARASLSRNQNTEGFNYSRRPPPMMSSANARIRV